MEALTPSMLIYLSYPIMDSQNEPIGLSDLLINTPENWKFYRPRLLLQDQIEMQENLNCEIPENTRKKFEITKQTAPLATCSNTVLNMVKELEKLSPPTSGPAVVLKNLMILAISDMVVVFGDYPDFGERSMELLWANLLGKHIIGITDRFFLSPWFQLYTDSIVKNSSTVEEVLFRGSLIEAKKKNQ